MLELIVLGQIPGTNIYISFTALAALVLVLLITGATGLHYIKKHYTNIKQKQAKVEEQAI